MDITPLAKILDEIDKIPFNDENDTILSTKWTQSIQIECIKFIEKNDIVLEIGGRYGIVSFVINNLLDNKKNHVVIEPDDNVITALKINKKAHDNEYHILNSYISNNKKKIYKWGQGTFLFHKKSDVVNKFEHGYIDIPEKQVNYFDIKKKYNLEFNTIILDCNGCIQDVIDNIGDDIVNIEKIICYKDYPWLSNYVKINKYLIDHDFLLANDGQTKVYLKKNKLNLIFPKINNYNRLQYDLLTNIVIYKEAEYISKIILENFGKDIHIMDCMAGIGGNTFSFCKYFKNVTAVEYNYNTFNMLKNNIKVYGFKNISLLKKEVISYILNDYKYDVFYFDVPLPEIDVKTYDFFTIKLNILLLNKYKLIDIVNIIKKKDKNKKFVFRLSNEVNNRYNLNEFNGYDYKIFTVFKHILLII
jgi:16S rRNA A1518/A1519 N6-dimethyltransferase RsmA/KsgA/DIM1 with predicted DNA glycosylase/AP lyase activity